MRMPAPWSSRATVIATPPTSTTTRDTRVKVVERTAWRVATMTMIEAFPAMTDGSAPPS